ncbi:MAG: ABC transporter substrate-binding protein [Deltaproteobacteria bacterium]|nr:ABC transporter substrate-binding protein [Deltaproteobacteria bacterium]
MRAACSDSGVFLLNPARQLASRPAGCGCSVRQPRILYLSRARKSFLVLLFVIQLLALPLWAAERLLVANSALNLLTAPIWVARERGFFLRHGLDVETIYIPSGTLAVQALLSGDIKIGLVAGSPIVNANLQGASVKIIAGNTNYYPLAFFATADIKDPRDLRGKKVAVTRVGSSSYTATVILLRKFGLEEGRDYAILQLGSTQNRLGALTKGIIQGTTLSAPESIMAKKAGMKVLIPAADMKKLGVVIQHQAVAAAEKTLRETRSSMKAFLMGYLEGVREVYRNKEATLQSVGKYTRVSDPLVLSASYEESYDAIDKEGALVDEGIQVILAEIAKSDPRALKARTGQFFDPTLLQELTKEGFIKALWSPTK